MTTEIRIHSIEARKWKLNGRFRIVRNALTPLQEKSRMLKSFPRIEVA